MARLRHGIGFETRFADSIPCGQNTQPNQKRQNTAVSTARWPANIGGGTRKHFGTWRKSLTAAGIDINRLYRGTRGRQPAEVVEAINRRQDQGLPMNRCHVMLEDNDLCMIGIRLFGSWGRALEAAGITLQETDPKWNQESIVRAIQIRYAKGGSLKHKAVRKSERSLYNAARSHFGSWHAARRRLGLRGRIPTIENRNSKICRTQVFRQIATGVPR